MPSGSSSMGREAIGTAYHIYSPNTTAASHALCNFDGFRKRSSRWRSVILFLFKHNGYGPGAYVVRNTRMERGWLRSLVLAQSELLLDSFCSDQTKVRLSPNQDQTKGRLSSEAVPMPELPGSLFAVRDKPISATKGRTIEGVIVNNEHAHSNGHGLFFGKMIGTAYQLYRPCLSNL
ncbi:hypothetical protein ACFOET_06815 [Parapedobacter deserti]|uniref:Uncharacterized protein n=1 Tax=Parapedobacter deserti TaxID=1912957 RepID=A0ABV7JLZ6_9SPHI